MHSLETQRTLNRRLTTKHSTMYNQELYEKNNKFLFIIVFGISTGVYCMAKETVNNTSIQPSKNTITLPTPAHDASCSLEKAINERRSIRSYKETPLTLKQISQLLWAAQGITNGRGFRTAPSAGAKYPIEIYLASGNISNLPAGIYKYAPKEHTLLLINDGDMRNDLCKACVSQPCVKNGACSIIICAVMERVTKKYPARGQEYTFVEVGCVSENIHLQATALNLGTVYVGGFDSSAISKILTSTQEEIPVCVMPVGHINQST